jgi:hypothetical protein
MGTMPGAEAEGGADGTPDVQGLAEVAKMEEEKEEKLKEEEGLAPYCAAHCHEVDMRIVGRMSASVVSSTYWDCGRI